eukprot:m.3456 g.3456  ORF g.3456 m.3456 type:complete len:240 (-) comp2072_c0_seq1:118-837(-)
MTTAHRPTWTPAQGGTGRYDGGLGSISVITDVHDAPSHTKLKFRHEDDIVEKDANALRAELEERESKHFQNVKNQTEIKAGISAITNDYEEDEEENDDNVDHEAKRAKMLLMIQGNSMDEDLPEEGDSDSDSDSDSDDDEEDTAQILAELEKIKKEKEEEKQRDEERKKLKDTFVRRENVLQGNPLLNAASDFSVKQRWDEDTVFKNCAKVEDKEKKYNYINDTLRSESHKKFMDRYIK